MSSKEFVVKAPERNDLIVPAPRPTINERTNGKRLPTADTSGAPKSIGLVRREEKASAVYY